VLGADLAIGSSIAGGASDFLGGTASRRIGTLRFMLAFQLVGLVGSIAWVAVSRDSLPGGATLLVAAGAGAAMAVGLGAFFEAMVVGTMSIVAPLSASGVVVPLAVAAVRGQLPSTAGAAGIVLTVSGIVFVSRAPRAGPSQARESGIALALLAATGVGVFYWLMAAASRHGAAWPLLDARAVLTAAFAAPLVVTRTSVRPLRDPRNVPSILSASLLGFVSMTMYALATEHGQLAIVSVLAALFPAVTVLLAYFVLGERITSSQRMGVGVVLAGVVLMTAT
jgi:drug/metabolite transporter (DMT)-like permease